MVQTSTLQNAVGGISTAADNALLSFQRLGLGIVGYMGMGTGSILGLLQAAVSASDKFGQSQRQLANIFLSNNMFGGATAFEDAMINSSKVMEDIKQKAQQFSLPAGEMVQFTKLIGAALISHGLDDSTMKKSIDISRGFLKSAPTLGIDPNLAQGQLLDAAMGRANLGDTLFQRLMNETTAMKPFKGSPKGFNALPDAKRIQVLTDALMQFGSNAKVLEGNAKSLTGEFQRLRDSMTGMFSILRPIGDVITNFILPAFHELNNYLQTHGAAIFKDLARMLKNVSESPKQLIITLMQLRDLKKDVNLAGEISKWIGIFITLKEVLGFFGIKMMGLSGMLRFMAPVLSTITGGFSKLFSVFGRLLVFITGASGVWGALFSIFNGLFIFASRLFLPFALLLGLFQMIRRAIAIAHVEDALAIAELMPKFTSAMARLKEAVGALIAPFVKYFDIMAKGIAPIFRISYYFEALIWLLNQAADVIVLFLAGFQGVFFAVATMLQNLASMFTTGNFDIFKGVGEAFQAGMDMMIADMMGKVDAAEGGVVNSVNNIGKIEIQNNFKEQMEPDRIAFTLKEQLLKTAQNPTQALGRSFSGALSR